MPAHPIVYLKWDGRTRQVDLTLVVEKNWVLVMNQMVKNESESHNVDQEATS
jgi:hypothetical protein